MVEGPQYRGPLVSFLRKSASGERYIYVPRGPNAEIGEESRGAFLEDLSSAISALLPSGFACIRYDTTFPSPYNSREYWSSNGQWKGAPRPQLRELRMNFGTKNRLLRKSPVDHLCPDTVVVDLRAEDDELLSRMRSTTRNCVRRGLRSGAEYLVRDAEWLEEWHAIYSETASRKGFYSEELSYFKQLIELSEAERGRGSPEFILMSATKGGKPLAGIILGIAGNQGYYLYAGSTTDGRECMPNYGLQWEALRLLRDRGCISYDLMGIPPNGDPNHSMYGLYTFKTGLGGSIVHYAGCWDYPLDEERYARMINAENMGHA